MDAKFKAILDSLPDKPPRSRLEPYSELIEELRRRGRTYRDISDILAEKCGVQVTASGIHDFLRSRSMTKGKSAKRNASGRVKSRTSSTVRGAVEADLAAKASAEDEAQAIVAVLKARKPGVKPDPERFQFDPSEPLRIKKAGKQSSAR